MERAKEENGDQGIGATAFDYPNNVAPQNYNDIYHTKMKVPRPNNALAEKVNADAIMRAVREGR